MTIQRKPLHKYSLSDKVFAILLFFLLVSNSILGNQLTVVKGLFLVLLVAFSVFECIYKNHSLNRRFIFVFCFILYFIFSSFVGVARFYEWDESCSRLIRYYILFPICTVFIAESLSGNSKRKVLFFKVLNLSTLLVLVFCIFEQLYTLKYISSWPFHGIMNIEGIIMSETKTVIQLSCETIFSFLIPYYVLSLFDKKKGAVSFLIVLLFSFYLLLSERKILVLIFGVSLALLIIKLLFKLVVKKSYSFAGKVTAKKAIKFIVSLVVLVAVFIFLLQKVDVSKFIDQAMDHLTSGLENTNEGIVKRTRQMSALFSGWLEEPISFLFGHGSNSYLIDDLASTYYKWDYEVFYASWSYQYGFIGICFLATAVFYIIIGNFKAYSFSHDNRFIYIAISFLMALVSAGTNPCITEYWFFLLPLCFLTVNTKTVCKRRKDSQSIILKKEVLL